MLLVFSSVIRSEIEGSEPALSILEGRSDAPSFPFLCHPRTKREPALSPLEGNPESSTLVFERRLLLPRPLFHGRGGRPLQRSAVRVLDRRTQKKRRNNFFGPPSMSLEYQLPSP